MRIPEPPRVGMLCPDPALPCPGFRPHDLSFVLSREEVARDEQRSDSFFAVILRSGPACSIAEEERRRTQEDFPGRKVFAHRFGCDDDVENNVTYTGVDQGLAFLAVYAGENRPAGDSALAAAGRYAGANLRRMQVVYVYP